MKVVIVGGVAAGASAAARLRRLDEKAEIILLERGPYISYANCGLPYHLGGVIPERDSLLVMSEQGFTRRFNIDVRTASEVTHLDPLAKIVTVKYQDKTYQESYDKLLLATGSSPLMFELPGMNAEKVFPFWTIPDMDKVIARMTPLTKKAVIVGGGFIGIEIAENLRHRGFEVTIVEMAPQVLPTLDTEMSSYLAQELIQSRIALQLGRKVTAFENGGKNGSDYFVLLDNGEKISADLVIMSVGVRPNSELAKNAALKLGPRGHIVVDETLQTSDPNIFAAGDVIEVMDMVTMTPTAIPLAGPANKQGRIAAGNIAGQRNSYSGSLGAAIIKVGKLTAASCGLTERRIQQLNLPYQKIYTHPGSNASYYPGGAPLHIKLLFSPEGKILGAQIVGSKGVDKRIDVIATAMKYGKQVNELADLELSYAPPYNSAKDPVNFLGMIADNVLKKLTDTIHVEELLPPLSVDYHLLDVREAEEFEMGTIPGAVNIPLRQLRNRLAELDKSKKVVAFCRVGLRGYLAERILKQHGFDSANLSGGYLTYQTFHPLTTKRIPNDMISSQIPVAVSPQERLVDVRSLACPGPVVRLKKEMDALAAGATLSILAAESFAPDLMSWLQSNGYELVSLETKQDELQAVVRKQLEGKGCDSENVSCHVGQISKNNSAAIILFSNDLDKALAALIVACGMAAAGSKVSIFFTFWGLSVLRKNPTPAVKKGLVSRMFGWMLPRGANRLALSKMNMGGLGTMMMKQVMTRENVPSLEELLKQAKELGIQFIACEMAMNIMGLTKEELIDVDSVAGVASFAALAQQAGTTLFI